VESQEKPKCSEGCGKPVHSKGLCQPCYRRLRRNGTTAKQGPKVLTPDVVAQSTVFPGNGCQLWSGSTDSSGYPRFYVSEGQQLINVRRWLAEQWGFDIDGKHVEDTCDTKSCVLREHLVVVDPHSTEKTRAGRQKMRSQLASEQGKCVNGHELDANGYCGVCARVYQQRHHGRQVDDTYPVGPKNGDKTTCPKGHPYDTDNTRIKPDGSRGCKKCHVDAQRRLMYDLDVADWLRMLEEQDGKCAICQTEFTPTVKAHTDHDHSCCPRTKASRTCGKCIRGLLCGRCNTGIGQLRDNPQYLRAAADYIETTSTEKHPYFQE
jgi:hypothetical protein